MNKFFNVKKAFSTPANRLLRIFLALFFAFSLFSLASCKKETDYFAYVSELRSNVLLCKTDEYSLRAYATTKEYPYATDGVAHESTTRLEIFLLANDTTKEYYIYFTVNGKEYGGYFHTDKWYIFKRAYKIVHLQLHLLLYITTL